jgi:hypothetical protein
MSVLAQLQFTQGVNVGAPGQALIGVTGSGVVVSNVGSTDPIINYQWTWVDVPHISAIPVGLISTGNTPQISFTPDVVGDYHLELIVTGDNGFKSKDRRVFRVLRTSGRAIPSFDAEALAMNFSGRKRGWAVDMDVWLEYLDSLNTLIPVPTGATGAIQVHGWTGSPSPSGAPNDYFQGVDAKLNADSGFDFTRGTTGATAIAKSGWGMITTTDASSHKILGITIPSGDCYVSVQGKLAYYYSSTGANGGTFSFEATFKKSSGTLTLVSISDLTPTGLAVGTAPGGATAAVASNTEIDVNVTGIAATTLKWVASVHVQVAI